MTSELLKVGTICTSIGNKENKNVGRLVVVLRHSGALPCFEGREAYWVGTLDLKPFAKVKVYQNNGSSCAQDEPTNTVNVERRSLRPLVTEAADSLEVEIAESIERDTICVVTGGEWRGHLVLVIRVFFDFDEKGYFVQTLERRPFIKMQVSQATNGSFAIDNNYRFVEHRFLRPLVIKDSKVFEPSEERNDF